MKKIYKFHWDCRRAGDLHGLFVADDSDVQKAIGKRLYFGEVLGKHSEIYGELAETDLKVVSENAADIDCVERLELSTGFNPLDYIQEEDEDD